MWVQNKMGTRPETALAQRSRRCFQNFWVTTGRLNFLWSNVSDVATVFTDRNPEEVEIYTIYHIGRLQSPFLRNPRYALFEIPFRFS